MMFNDDGIKIFVSDDIYHGTINLWVFLVENNKRSYVSNMTMTTVENDAIPRDETPIRLSSEAAKVLMDRLWDVGIRPTATKDRSEVISAKQEHLQDLRRALFLLMERKP